MTSTSDDSPKLTCDAFLGGQLKIWQPATGYRAGVDPVLLAASVPAQPGQSVLELGCGVGVAALCLQKRIGDLDLFGLELQPLYAGLAVRNGRENGLALQVEQGDLMSMPAALRQRQFDHVLANPPYFPINSGTSSADPGRARAMQETIDLGNWTDAASRRLLPRGRVTMILKASRLPDASRALDDRFGDMRILPICPRAGRPAELILITARKGARGAFKLLPPIAMHSGDRHDGDKDSYVPAISAVLRKGVSLPVNWA